MKILGMCVCVCVCVCVCSTQAHKLNPVLHDCCRIISGCLKPTNLDSVHILAGIAPPHIRRTVACRIERTRQTTDARHQLFDQQPAASRLKWRKSFMRTVTPLDSSASSGRLRLWKDSLTDVPASVKMGLEVAESLPAGSGEDWLCWRALNRPRTGGGPCENSDEEMGLSRRRPVCGMRLRGATDDCPPPLLPSTRRVLHGCRPGYSDRAGNGMRPQVGKNCVKDTKEEEDQLITGDFNAKEICWETWSTSSSDKMGQELLECLEDASLT